MVGLLLGVSAVALLLLARTAHRARRDRALRTTRRLRLSCALLTTDIAVLAERAARAGLDVWTLEAHDRAAQLVATARTHDELRAAAETLLEVQPGPPCFFDPAHGLSTSEVRWPVDGPGAVHVPACDTDVQLLAAGRTPQTRMVRREDVSVRWFEAGPTYDAYAHAWFGRGPAAAAVDAVRATAPKETITAGAWDRLRWAVCSNGGLGEAPHVSHHRIGQLTANQHLAASTHPTLPRRRF